MRGAVSASINAAAIAKGVRPLRRSGRGPFDLPFDFKCRLQVLAIAW
jgi:hypothetical protein